jgi:hypothetical protein
MTGRSPQGSAALHEMHRESSWLLSGAHRGHTAHRCSDCFRVSAAGSACRAPPCIPYVTTAGSVLWAIPASRSAMNIG